MSHLWKPALSLSQGTYSLGHLWFLQGLCCHNSHWGVLVWFGLIGSPGHPQETRTVHTCRYDLARLLIFLYTIQLTSDIRKIYRTSPSLFWQFLQYAWWETRPDQMIKWERKYILFITNDASLWNNFSYLCEHDPYFQE